MKRLLIIAAVLFASCSTSRPIPEIRATVDYIQRNDDGGGTVYLRQKSKYRATANWVLSGEFLKIPDSIKLGKVISLKYLNSNNRGNDSCECVIFKRIN